MSYQEENIKRELVKNGPVIVQTAVHTDFLPYKEGIYHKTENSFKFNGAHIVKLLGWQKAMDGSTEWIVQNSWGADWGMDGYAIMTGRDGSGVDQFAIAPTVMPYTMYDYMSM